MSVRTGKGTFEIWGAGLKIVGVGRFLGEDAFWIARCSERMSSSVFSRISRSETIFLMNGNRAIHRVASSLSKLLMRLFCESPLDGLLNCSGGTASTSFGSLLPPSKPRLLRGDWCSIVFRPKAIFTHGSLLHLTNCCVTVVSKN